MLLGAKSAAVDWLVVGLGNPGSKYEHTRHNMGFLTVDLLAEQAGVKLNKVKFKSAYNILRFAGAKCLVMKPQTYMNLSGEAVREAVQFYKLPADRVLVIYDDVSLPVGKIRVRPTGSAGGHNGIKNIIAHLGTQDFPRIKIGTGAPGEGGDMIDWVIGVPSQAERKVLGKALERLTSREQTIVRLRFGLGVPGGEEKTQKEVADVLGISQSYISRLEKKIMQRLKREMVKYS